MEDKELQEQEFTLEDILREFGSGIAEEPETPEEEKTEETPEKQTNKPEEATEEADEEVTQEVVEEAAEDASEEPTEATPQSAVTGDTIRLEKIPETAGQVRNAQHIDDEDDAPFIPEQPEKTEPFSSEWEPDYEQPIAEYTPPRPIIFHPRSRLRELKRKLVAGPEKEYYALSEKGLGKLQTAIFFSLLVVLLSVGATAANALGWVPESRLRLMVFGQFMAMLVSALLGSFQLLEGAADLWHKRFSLNTLLLFTFVLCCADGVMGLYQLRVPCCAAFSLQVTMSLWSAYQNRNTKLGQLDTMRKATRLDSISGVPDYYEDMTGLLRGEGQVEDFLDTYQQPAKLEKVLSVYALVSLCVSVAAGVLAAVLHGVSAGIQVAAVTALAAMPASLFVAQSRPMAVLERRLHKLGAVLCGWQSVEALSGKVLFPLKHTDLFPAGSANMNGVKFFGSRQPDEIIAYATALVAADGGSLEPLFTHLLDSRNGMHYTLENYRSYPEGGIGGEVNGEPVLAGSLAFLKEMGVETPEGIRVNQAVCVAIDGELCGLFAIAFEKDRDAAAGMYTLCGYRGLCPTLVSPDFMLTPEFIHSTFGVNVKRMLFPAVEDRKALQEKTPEPEHQVLALITGEGLEPFACAVTGARSLKTAATLGVIVHMVGGILGVVMMLVLAVIGAMHLLTPANLFLYELVWLVPGLLITEWTRSI